MGEAARARAQAARPALVRRKGPSPKGLRVEHLVFPLIVAAGLVAYHNSFRGPFVFDDIPAITWNTSIRTLWPPSTVFSAPPRNAATGRPIVNLSLALNYALGGYDVVSYHVFNVGIHILSALLLFGIILRTLRSPGLRARYLDSAVGIAGAVALLWVVHPLNTESVSYTIQRTELLGGLFLLSTLYCAIRGFESPKKRGWHNAALVTFALGLGSKEIVALAPVLVFAWDGLFWSASWKQVLRRHRRLYIGFGIVLLILVLFVGTRLRKTFRGIATQNVTPWRYALTQSGALVHYLRLAIWPHPLSADYDGWPIATSVISVLPYLAIILTLLALTFWGLVRRHKLAFPGVWFFAILAPTSSIRPLSWEVVAERRMYLPLAAVVLLAVLGGVTLLRTLRAPRQLGGLLVVALSATLAFVTIRRNEDYRTPVVFWNDIVTKRPDNPRARISLGTYMHREGRSAEALTHLAEAVRLNPASAHARSNLANVLASQGRTGEAIEQYREGVRLDPEDGRTRFNYARALVRQGRRQEAIEQLEELLRTYPGFTSANQLLDRLRNVPAR